MCTNHDAPDKDEEINEIVDAISADSFDEWYQERQYRQNIENGTSYFNGPPNVPVPSRHSPSRLLQCHRRTAYHQLNAPAETSDPVGIFWIGSRFEEDIALPFLRESVADDDEYITNSLWIDFTVQTDVGEIQIKGETDPVVVDQEAKPLIITEIKTKRSVEDVTSPNRHHLAQTHAYMRGLSEKYDRNITDAVILYGGRTNLDIRAFHVEFDPVFWRQTVLAWSETHTKYRLEGELPPADPEYDWECAFCSYRERCGQGDLEYSDVKTGLLHGYSDYPRSKVVEYLEAHEQEKLTPTLAQIYPKLTERFDVHDWLCEKCDSEIDWEELGVKSDGTPQCPECDPHDSAERSTDSKVQDQSHTSVATQPQETS